MAIEKSVRCDVATCKLRERSLGLATTATKTNGQIAKRTLAVPDFAWLIVSIPRQPQKWISLSRRHYGSTKSHFADILECRKDREDLDDRAQENFDTISLISSLFNLNQSILLFVNKWLKMILTGVSRLGKISSSQLHAIALGGLVKVQSLIEENADFDGHDLPVGSLINVPIRCACPASPQRRNGVKYLDVPEVRWRAGSLPGSSPAPGAVFPLEKVVPACGLLICIRCHPRRFQPLTPRSSVSSNVSPDFLDGMSKLKQSLINFSLEELRTATEDFNEASKIGVEVYREVELEVYYLAIEQMESEEGARRVIYILTKINHLNIVKLEGIYNGANPYLVYEFAENGSLRDCLSNKKLDRQLTWLRRMQIAFDLADALHYLTLLHSTSLWSSKYKHSKCAYNCQLESQDFWV
ncbi:hypothetical protein D5086_028423 [Populus alba]|uniref:Uncharacterized protein n=1 Tax=Populus alba TaxID=43335 RepID=A0ACC4AYP4_POPAL